MNMQQAQMIICACCAFYFKVRIIFLLRDIIYWYIECMYLMAYNFSQYNLQVTTNEKKFIRFGNFTIFLP